MGYLNSIKRFIFTCNIFLILVNSINALEPLKLEETKEYYPVGLHLEIFEDKTANLTIDDVRKPELDNQWFINKKESPSFGYSKSVYWVRFEIENNLPFEKEWLLEVGYPLIDFVDCYIFDTNGNFVLKQTGDRLPFKEREVSYRNFIFNFKTTTNQKKRIYLSFKGDSSMQFPMTIWSNKQFIEKVNTETISLGLYYGIMVAMVLYNLFIFLSVKDLSYLFYILYISSYTIVQMSLNGLTYEYFWSNSPWWGNHSLPFIISLCSIAILVFANTFLKIKENIPRFHKFFPIFLVIGFGLMIGSFVIKYSIIGQASILFAVLVAVIALVLGFICVYRGYRPARYYLIAWSVFLISILLFTFKSFGLIPAVFITNYGIQLGSAAEVILLSFALADRINIMEQEKKDAQQKALDIQEKANQDLEIKVQKRTEELKDAQEKILIMEKEAVERQMAGGFAHEMRNALAGAKMVISKALGFGNPDEGQKSICLENSLKLKDVFLKLRNILNEEQLRTVTIIFKEINANEEDLDRILKIVNQATERGLSITNQIMEYSKIGQSAFRKSDLVDIGNIILNIQKESNDLIQKENISLEIQLENSFHLKGDELHFYSVFKNIIQNSIDALIDKTNSKELKRTIQISGKSSLDSTYVFHISDNGIGIPNENLNRIYDPFFSTKPETGTGLGLGVVNKIVNLYNGKIKVESEPKKGTTFIISFPTQT